MIRVDALTHVLLALDAARTRATYGAVAGHLGVPAMFLMNGRPRDPLHSWVVSKKDGRPTGYPEELWHADLLQNDRVIDSTAGLAAFLG
jgi:hypothetical protein